jgi:hypothetical protein
MGLIARWESVGNDDKRKWKRNKTGSGIYDRWETGSMGSGERIRGQKMAY